MSVHIKPGVYTRHIDYSLYSKVNLKDFVNKYSAGYTKKVKVKLRAKWTVERRAQLSSVHGIDAEKELTASLADQLRSSIDKQIMGNLGNVIWDEV